MKVFCVFAVFLGLVSTFFGVKEGNLLLILSSISMSLGFIFLYYYYKNKSARFMNLFTVFLAIYSVLTLITMFTEKGYF